MISTSLVAPAPTVTDKDLLAEASAIGDRFAGEAIVHKGRANWVVRKINYPGESKSTDMPTVTQLNSTFYSGVAGVGVYLLRLHSVTGEKKHRDVGAAAIRNAAALAKTLQRNVRNGFYLGGTGIVWSAHEAWIRLKDPAFRRARDDLLTWMWDRRRQPEHTDLMFGNAGAIAPLLRIYEDEQVERAWELALWHGKRLLRAAEKEEDRWSWPGEVKGPNFWNLTGFSHGTSGYGWALAHLARATGTAAYREAAEGAFAYERKWFEEDAGNWRDFRNWSNPDHPPPRKFGTVWCHGAPGIGIGRIAASKILDDPRLVEDMRVALKTTRRSVAEYRKQVGGDMSGCHGLYGNAECAWLMAEALGEPDALEWAREVAAWGLARYGAKTGVDWPTAVVTGLYPPLVTGAGMVGHYLLRAAFPGRFDTPLIPPAPRV